MELFALDNEVARLEQLQHPDVPEIELELAWQLRQRDATRALTIANRTLPKLEHNLALSLRGRLIQAEYNWLHAEMDSAWQMGRLVLQQAAEYDLPILEADAHWLLGWICFERADLQARDHAWQSMRACAMKAGDLLRADIADANLAVMAAFRSVHDSAALLERYRNLDLQALHPSLRAIVCDYLGLHLRLSSESEQTIAYWMRAYEAALQSGQVRRALITAGNVGNMLSSLNDNQAALEWMERTLQLAREQSWPSPLGYCLLQTATCLHSMGKIDAAQEMLQETLHIMRNLKASRNYASVLWFMGDLAISRKDYELALRTFNGLREQADVMLQADFQISARRGQAQALAALHRADEALHVAESALQLARQQQDLPGQMEILRVLAKIHSRHKLPPPENMRQPSPALHYLKQALQLGESIRGYIVPGCLLDEIADAHAAAGNFGKAFAYGRRANSAREKTHNALANHRAMAMQVQHQAERARAESEHLRALAQAQAQRAQAEANRAALLQDTSNTLSHLGAIGQEITAQLDLEGVFSALRHHVRAMLDANYFVIYLLHEDGQHLYSIFRQQAGLDLPAINTALSNPHSYTAASVRERQEILVNMQPGQDNPALLPDAAPTLSALFAPLMVNQRVLGAITIQSAAADAYGERERLIFRSLCAYGAIALDNAQAYRQLKEAQQQLVAQEKLAALGSLVAGVAHELNTPLGNSLIIATALQDSIEQLDAHFRNKTLSQHGLQEHIADAREACGMILRGLHSAANLVTSFKQVAVDSSSEQWRAFDLLQTTQEVVATMMNQIKVGGHSMQLDIAPNIIMHSYPGRLGQVLISFISNALAHAFYERRNGCIELRAEQQQPGRILLHCSDNGCGIAKADLKHIFDPFFTTRLGQGGNGLGLSVSYNIVNKLLGGKIHVTSSLGQGSCFTLDLPLRVAQANQTAH